MKTTVDVSNDGRYVLIKTNGGITREEAFESIANAHQFGRSHNINRYLFDATDSQNVDSVTNNYEFAHKDMKQPGVDRDVKVAMLVAPDDHTHDFVEIVSLNAGFNVKLVRDREAAIRFLLE